MAEANLVKNAFRVALEHAATTLLGSTLDGPFSAISYPPGYNFVVEYGQPVYHNAATLGVIDQLCVKDANGIVGLTGDSFSMQYKTILETVVYNLSTPDKQNLAHLQIKFGEQEKAVIASYESAFEPITQRQIDDSNCFPPNKIGYIEEIIKTKYSGDPQEIPLPYAGFSSAYEQWILLARQLNGITSRQSEAEAQKQAAIDHITTPSAENGGWQTGTASYGVAYTGMPALAEILSSLATNDRKLTVIVELTGFSQKTFNVNVGDTLVAQVPSDVITIDFVEANVAQSRSLVSLSGSASKIEMSIVYPGITILPANPVELSADCTTGWYSQYILSEVAQKTGKDVTGFQLQGSEFATAELFGPGKTFARVKTFVISQEPTVQLAFYDPNNRGVIQNAFKPGDAVRLQLADEVRFGATSGGFNVQKVDFANGKTVVTLGPPTIVGTIPTPEQTAYIIGGVVEYPPMIFGSAKSGSITVKNQGGFVATFSVQYVQNRETVTEESGEFPIWVTKTLQLPVDATDILVTVKIATFVKIWTTVANYNYDTPVTKLFELTGETWSPECREV